MASASITPEIILVAPTDRRLARLEWPVDCAGFEQSEPFESEPIYIVVPVGASDKSLVAMARRFDVSIGRLSAFQARQLAAASSHEPLQQFAFEGKRIASNRMWWEFFIEQRKLFRVVGNGSAPTYDENQLLWVFGLDQPLEQDLEVVIDLRSPHDGVRAVSLLAQINAFDNAFVEVVDCYRASRITIARENILAIQVVMGGAHEVEEFNHVLNEPREVKAIGCFVETYPPVWLRHQQTLRPALAADRSRDPWSIEEAA